MQIVTTVSRCREPCITFRAYSEMSSRKSRSFSVVLQALSQMPSYVLLTSMQIVSVSQIPSIPTGPTGERCQFD